MRPARAPLVSFLASSLVIAGAGVVCAACSGDFDTTRAAPVAKTTLGEEMYTTLCDRVGSSSFAEDLSGISYRKVCHKLSNGWTTSSTVDESTLPPVGKGSQAAEQRRLGVAKMNVMARHRNDLIEAFDTLLPDVNIDDPLKAGQRVRLHDALTDLTRRFVPLYESSPYTTKGVTDPPLLPATTQTLARFFEAIASSPDAQAAFARIGARQGYRPLPLTLGAIRPLLAYPRLRQLSKLLVDRMGPGGTFEPAFQQLLAVVQQELRTLQPDDPVPFLTVDAGKVQPNRARQKLEILSELLLAQDDAFVRVSKDARYIAARDARGYVLPLGYSPGAAPAPFVTDKNGYPAVDSLGRFLDGSGTPLVLAPPFATPDWLLDQTFSYDAQKRATDGSGALLYQYLDTSRTLTGSLLTDFQPLVATPQSPSGALQSSLMQTLTGTYVLYGDKTGRTASYQTASDKKAVSIDFQGFDASTSPLIDLTYATGQLLGAPGSDDYIGSILDLHQKHPEKTAEGVALAWKIRNQSRDAKYDGASLADGATFWDDMAEWIAKVARVPVSNYVGASTNPNPRGLMQDLTIALSVPASVQWLPAAYAPAMLNSDRITYNTNDINGAPLDLDTGKPLTPMAGPTHPVNRGAADTGDNRSALQRFLHVIAASSKVKACNKQGSLVKSTLTICGIPIALTYPITLPLQPTQTIDECNLFQIDDLGVFFIDSTLDWNHPRRANLQIKDTTLTGLLDAVKALVPSFCGEINIDSVLEKSSGINGLTRTPTPEALSRLVFFGANSSAKYADVTKLPDLDPNLAGKNATLDTFISNTVEPVGTITCAKDAKGVNQCKNFGETLRGLGQNTFFVSETPWLAQHPPGCVGNDCAQPSSGFFEGMRPTLTAFANYQYDPDPGEVCLKDAKTQRCAGEQMFVDLVAILDKHWTSSSPSALVRYEELLAWVFGESGLFATISSLVPTLRDQAYVSPRVKNGQTRSGLEVTSELLTFLFDQQYAKKIGLTQKNGDPSTTTNDGKTKAQVTPYDLFVGALRGMDARFDAMGTDGAAKKAEWRAARSALIDQFLLADPTAWKNPATAAAIPVLTRLVREQVNANCPDRESTGTCDWARNDLSKKLAAVMEGPLFASINDLQESLRGDDEARAELESLLTYLLAQEQAPDTLTATLTSLADLLQVLHGDADLAPVFNAISVASAPGIVPDKNGKPTPQATPGLTHETLKVLKVLLDDSGGPDKAVDRYHVLDVILKNLVTPAGDGKQTPLEVLIDTVADVQRIDSSSSAHLSADDYKQVASGVRSFLVDPLRGLEQFYCIAKGRDDSSFDPTTRCKLRLRGGDARARDAHGGLGGRALFLGPRRASAGARGRVRGRRGRPRRDLLQPGRPRRRAHAIPVRRVVAAVFGRLHPQVDRHRARPEHGRGGRVVRADVRERARVVADLAASDAGRVVRHHERPGDRRRRVRPVRRDHELPRARLEGQPGGAAVFADHARRVGALGHRRVHRVAAHPRAAGRRRSDGAGRQFPVDGRVRRVPARSPGVCPRAGGFRRARAAQGGHDRGAERHLRGDAAADRQGARRHLVPAAVLGRRAGAVQDATALVGPVPERERRRNGRPRDLQAAVDSAGRRRGAAAADDARGNRVRVREVEHARPHRRDARQRLPAERVGVSRLSNRKPLDSAQFPGRVEHPRRRRARVQGGAVPARCARGHRLRKKRGAARQPVGAHRRHEQGHARPRRRPSSRKEAAPRRRVRVRVSEQRGRRPEHRGAAQDQPAPRQWAGRRPGDQRRSLLGRRERAGFRASLPVRR